MITLCAEVVENPTMMSPNMRLEITCNSNPVHHETHGEIDGLKHKVHCTIVEYFRVYLLPSDIAVSHEGQKTRSIVS